MRILVTGSSGFVGSALVRELRARGDTVAGFTRHENGSDFFGDLLDKQSVETALKLFKPDVVYNLAAQTALKGKPANGYAANIDGVRNLVDAVRHTPSVRRVVWQSSQLVARPGRPPKYDTQYDPADEYGASKAEGEQIIRQEDGGGAEWVVGRSTTIWGPGMSDHYANLLRLIQRGLYFHIGYRPQRKSFSYIENLTNQLAALGTAPSGLVNRKTFYLADSEPIEMHEWTGGFALEFGRSLPTVPPQVAGLLGFAGDVLAAAKLPTPITSKRLRNITEDHLYDSSPIEMIAGPSAVSNEEGIRRTANWFRARESTSHRDLMRMAPAAGAWPSSGPSPL